MSRRSRTVGALTKLAIFTAASLAVNAVLVAVIGNVGFGDARTYHAVFASASRLVGGDDVRIAGVVVGTVEGVELRERTKALVTFTVDPEVTLTGATVAEIRYLNLVGDRYLALREGTGDPQPLPAGGTIPLSRTQPALDLNVLFNGFKPLFTALDPDEVNKLAYEIVATLQGQGGTIEGLLAHTASLTSELADREQLIADVIDNLGAVLATLDRHHERLAELVTELRRWLGGLAEDRTAIGASLENINALAASTAALVDEGRPALAEDIAQLRKLAGTLSEPKHKRMIEHFLRTLPDNINKMTRTGTYGSWYNFYLCDLNATIRLPNMPDTDLDEKLRPRLENLVFHSTAARCQ